MRRPRALALLLLALGLALTSACSTGPTDDRGGGSAEVTAADADAFPVTLHNHWGPVTIEDQPQRVVTLGSNAQDFVLALGIVPVGASKETWGGNGQGSTPWFDAALAENGGAQPVRIDDSSGVPFDEIAELTPDLVFAPSRDLDRTTYDKLSRLAPVVSYPEAPYTTPWQTALTLAGKALGRTDEAKDVEKRTEAALAAARDEHPELSGTTVAYLSIQPTDLSQIGYLTPRDPRSKLLAELGLTTSPAIRKISAGSKQYYGMVSAERASTLTADMVILQNVSRGDIEDVVGNRLVRQVPAIAEEHYYVAPSDQAALALGGPTPLSVPWLVEHVVPGLAEVAAGAAA